MYLRPHPEERALARVSKDGSRLRTLRPSFETLASQAPQDEVRVNFRFNCQTAMRTCVRIPAARSARGLRQFRPCSMSRGRRESRVRAAPAVSCAEMGKKRTRAYRSSGGNPAFPARWFTAYSALSLVTGLSCHHRHADNSTRLDASVGASGPHGFAVRLSAVRYRHVSVHRIPPRVRDDHDTPLCGAGRADSNH